MTRIGQTSKVPSGVRRRMATTGCGSVSDVLAPLPHPVPLGARSTVAAAAVPNTRRQLGERA